MWETEYSCYLRFGKHQVSFSDTSGGITGMRNHIELAYSDACGKIISEFGALQILDESLVLAASSTNGFIKGKNCNRCQRIHELLSLAFRILHFQSYLAKIRNTEDVLDII